MHNKQQSHSNVNMELNAVWCCDTFNIQWDASACGTCGVRWPVYCRNTKMLINMKQVKFSDGEIVQVFRYVSNDDGILACLAHIFLTDRPSLFLVSIPIKIEWIKWGNFKETAPLGVQSSHSQPPSPKTAGVGCSTWIPHLPSSLLVQVFTSMKHPVAAVRIVHTGSHRNMTYASCIYFMCEYIFNA